MQKETGRDLYFILNPSLGIIKIGIADSVAARLKNLECACGVPLELMRVVKGGAEHEQNLHLAFDATRLKGEWFAPSAELLALADGTEEVAGFLRRHADAIAAVRARRQGERDAGRSEQATIQAEERARLDTLKKEAKRIREEQAVVRRDRAKKTAARKLKAEEVELARIEAARAEWAARSPEALKDRVTKGTQVADAHARQEAVTSQRSRNAALNGVAPTATPKEVS